MHTITTIQELRAQLGAWRRENERIGFVPTMGNLHVGHLELLRQAKREADRIVVSVFVNPMQFVQGEDLESYPRTPEQDERKLCAAGTDLLFTPTVETIYPKQTAVHTRVEVPGLSDTLCGASRPGHFVGVATVVCKLFNMVQPDVAVFGEKDYQQLMVIRRMVQDLALPVTISAVATQREQDGLALSSRNAYLSKDERQRAPALYRMLATLEQRIRAGEIDYPMLEKQAIEDIEEVGYVTDYVSVRSADDLAPAKSGDRRLVILAAAFLGKTRLIDNLRIVL